MKALDDSDTAFFKFHLRGKAIVNWAESIELFERGHNRIPRGTHSGHEDGTNIMFLNAEVFGTQDTRQVSPNYSTLSRLVTEQIWAGGRPLSGHTTLNILENLSRQRS